MLDPLVTVDTLRQNLSDPDWLIIDVRHSLVNASAGQEAYRQGHIPGARFLNQDTQLAGRCTGLNGRHPLPDRDWLRNVLCQYGLTPHSRVVVYDAGNASFATRAWWLLRWIGHARAAVLDGGWQAWLAAGGDQQAGADQPVLATSNTTSPAKSTMPTISADGILAGAADRLLVDARDPARYRGETEPMDPVAGRIDGALNRPVACNLQADGRFKPASQLHDEFAVLLQGRKPDQVVHYCGSGITACHNIFAMEVAGMPGSILYPGSWSEWCSDPARPVARG